MHTAKPFLLASSILLVAMILFAGPTFLNDAESSATHSPTTSYEAIGPTCHPTILCDTLLYVVSSGEHAERRGLALALSHKEDSDAKLRVTSASEAAKDPSVITSIMKEDDVPGAIDRKTIPSALKVMYFGRVLPRHKEQDDRTMLVSFEGEDGRGHTVAGVGVASGTFKCAPRKTCERKGEASMKFVFEESVTGLKIPVVRGTASFKGSDEELQAQVWLQVSK
jgi:hypothetical protein